MPKLCWKLAACGMMLATPVSGGELPREGTTTVDVHVKVSHLRSGKGAVIACLTANAARFPQCRDDPVAHRTQVAAGRAGEIVFHGVKPGRYAIALLHDENGNGKADRAMSMIPREGFGFSRDAKVQMGPPRFHDAAFDIGDENKRLTINMRYMF